MRDCEQGPGKNPDQKMFPGSQEKFYLEHERDVKRSPTLHLETIKVIFMIVLICSHSLLSGLITLYEGRAEKSHKMRDADPGEL